MEEFEFVVAEENKFENWANQKKSSIPWKFRTVKTLNQGTQVDKPPIEKPSTSRILSMPTLIEEIKPVFLVKKEFENREN